MNKKLKSLAIIGVSLALIGALIKGFNDYIKEPLRQRTEQVVVQNQVRIISNDLGHVMDYLEGAKRAISLKNYPLAKANLGKAEAFMPKRGSIPKDASKSLFDLHNSLKLQLRALEYQIQGESK